jgi:hypothetical protein
VPSDTVTLVTSRHYADGDTVELIVQTVGDKVIMSDGGEVLARLDSVGLNMDSHGQVGKSWKRLMAARRSAAAQPFGKAIHADSDAVRGRS